MQPTSRACVPLEERYATYIQQADSDVLANAGVNILRIPTTYAAWIELPGLALYLGNQTRYLREIFDYAIAKYNMYIIIDIHSLPGGVNGQGIGEKIGNYGQYNNRTALYYSYQAVEAVISIQNSAYPGSFTIEPINKPSDNLDKDFYASSRGLSDTIVAWLVAYIQGVLDRVLMIYPEIPVMF